ncbi:MAG: hypothetical protein GF332_04445 [Candidatus Moranbacteria bacterium]|nr:hypothetical protein [Candidatus Moranbacteria bacterium]
MGIKAIFTYNFFKFFLLLLAVLLVSDWQTKSVLSDEQDNKTEQQTQEDQEISTMTQEEIQVQEEQLEEIEKKIKTYENLIEKKQEQKATLNNQIEIIENEIETTNQKVKKTNNEIEQVQLEVENLDREIKIKNLEIQYKQKILSELVKDIYYQKRYSSIELILKYKNLGDYFASLEQINKISAETKKILDQINQSKQELEAEKNKRNERLIQLKGLKNENLRNRDFLESQQNSKESLLETTQGQEEKYQDLLKKFEQQRETILGNFEQLTSEKSGELARVRASQKKPTSGLASSAWYFSQRDSRWGSDFIGMSRTRMDQYGCAVTSVAMVLRYHGVNIDPGVLAAQPIFYYDLIVWPSYWQDVSRASSSGHGNIDWDKIDKELRNKNPVIIFVGAKGKGAGHYVVIHGKDKKGEYVVHDPYWGSNIYLDSTRENISVLYGASTYIDQMIIYHGKGGVYSDIDEAESPSEEEEEKEKEDADDEEEESQEQLDCEDSGGRWEEKDRECDCPSGYEEDDGVCEK